MESSNHEKYLKKVRRQGLEAFQMGTTNVTQQRKFGISDRKTSRNETEETKNLHFYTLRIFRESSRPLNLFRCFRWRFLQSGKFGIFVEFPILTPQPSGPFKSRAWNLREIEDDKIRKTNAGSVYANRRMSNNGKSQWNSQQCWFMMMMMFLFGKFLHLETIYGSRGSR